MTAKETVIDLLQINESLKTVEYKIYINKREKNKEGEDYWNKVFDYLHDVKRYASNLE